MIKIKSHIPTVLIAMLFFASVYRGPSAPQESRVWMEVFFEISLYMSLVAIIWPWNRWLASFLILTCFSMFWPAYGQMSYLSGKAVFHGCLWYLFIVTFFNVHKLNTIYRIMRIITYFHVAIAIIQKSRMAVMFKTEAIVGLMANPLELAALIGFCFAAFIDLEKRRLFLIAIPFIGLIVAKQFLGIVAVGIGLIFYFATAHRIYWTVIPVIAISLLWYRFIDEAYPSIRLYVWKQAIMAWKQHWILGAGIGHWKVVFSQPMKIDGCRWFTTHNEFLQMLFELGVGAAAIFVGYAVAFVRNIRKELAIPMTAIVIIVIQSAFTFPMHIAPTAMIAVTWLAILDITLKQKENLKCQMT